MDLGELYASVRIDTGNTARDLGKVKESLDGVKESAEQVENKRVKISADDKSVKDAKKSTDELGTSADNAANKSARIKFPTQYTADADRAKTAIDGAVDSLGKMAWTAGKWGAATVATTAIAGIGTSLTKGWGRLTAIDTAQAKLEALGNSGADVQKVMDNALSSVQGTAFGIGEAAGTAATMVASGIKPGQELESVLKGVADSAAIAGSGMDEMGLIWGKAAAKGKIDGEIVNQLLERQIPIYDILSQKTGEASEDIADMVSEGEISFQQFAEAMNDYVGGGAVRMGDTVKGAMDNLGAAMGRFGAEGLKEIFAGTPDLLKEATAQFDAATQAVGPFASEISGHLMPAVEGLVTGIGPGLVASMNIVSDLMDTTTPAIGGLSSAMTSIPFPVWTAGLAALVGQHKGWTAKLDEGGGKAMDFGRTIGSVMGGVADNYRNADGVMAGTVANMKSGLNGVKGVAGNLVTALGGPWSLAIGAAGAAIGIFAQKHYEAAQAEIEHRSAQSELRGTLDETTGSISRQTEELQKKRAEEEGWLGTATQLGLSHNTLIDAMNGNQRAMKEVDSAVLAATTNAVRSSDVWAEHGTAFEETGVSAGVMAAALTGNKDALREVSEAGPGAMRNYYALRDSVSEATDEFFGLSDGVGEASQNLAEVQFEMAEQQLIALKEASRDTADALKMIGDVDLAIEDHMTISVGVDDITTDTMAKLDEIGVKSRTMNGRVYLEFPDGMDILAMLDQIGIKLESTPDGYINVHTEDVDAAIADLDTMGIKAHVQDGQLRIDTNAPEVIERLVELGILQKDFDGKVNINGESIVESDERMKQLQATVGAGADGQARVTDNTGETNANVNNMRSNVAAGADGQARMTDNAAQTRANINATLQGHTTQGYHVINEQRRITYWTSQGVAPAQAARIQGPVPLPNNASGGRLPTTGPGTNKTDGILGIDSLTGQPTSWVDAGEWIINRGRSERFHNTLGAINSGDENQILGSVLQDLERFETGGIAGSQKVKSELMPYHGTPYVFGGWGPSGTDCSGAVSMGVNSYLGLDPFDSRTSTMGMADWLAAKGAQPGRGDGSGLVVGWMNGGPGGGHTAMQLPDGTYIESGGNTGGGLHVGGPAGPLEGRGFTDWMHFPAMGGDTPEAETGFGSFDVGDFTTSGGGGGGGGGGGARYTGGGGGGGVTKTVNGGAGTLLKDGSALELAAAAYSLYTGQPMQDDVVSWGQLAGLGTTYEGEDLARQQRDNIREAEKLERSEAGTLRDIEQAKADLRKMRDELDAGGTGEGDKFKAFTDDERAERERRILDQQDRIADLEDSLTDIADSQRELVESQNMLRMAIEQAATRPENFGTVLGVTPMANGGILGAARQAQINDTSAVLWAEDGPEAYIPLSSDKRARSVDIWMETGKRLGLDAMSMMSLIVGGIPGLMNGQLDFSTGSSASLSGLGLNTDAASNRLAAEMVNSVGAVFNGPVQINDPKAFLQSQLNNASGEIQNAMRSMMIR